MDNDRDNEEEPLLVLDLPGVRIPSRNELDGLHWSKRHEIRRAWLILLARCLSGLSGSARAASTTTICRAVARGCAMQSLSRSAGAVILRPTCSGGSTARKKAGSVSTRSGSKSSGTR